jgi:spore germination protein KB
MEVGMTIIMTMSASIDAAAQDMWISIIIASSIALVIAFITTKLSLLYPNETMVQFSEKILGKFIGKGIVIVYLVQFYTIIPIILRQFSDMINELLLQNTPNFLIILTMMMLVVYVTFIGKLQGIGRCSEVLGPLIVLLCLAVFILSLNNLDFKKILPIYADHEIGDIVFGSLAPASYLGHAVEFFMLTPFIVNKQKGARAAIWGVVVSCLIVIISALFIILTVGSGVGNNMRYPFFEMTREISVGFLENVDPFVIGIWITSVFIKLSIYMFITSYATAQLLRVHNWRLFIWVIPPFAITAALSLSYTFEATTHYLLNYWVPIVLPINMIGLPLLLLIVGKIRQRHAH